MPGKRRFGGPPEQDERLKGVQNEAARRMGQIKGGLSTAAQAGPSTSPLAAKRAAGMQAKLGQIKGGINSNNSSGLPAAPGQGKGKKFGFGQK